MAAHLAIHDLIVQEDPLFFSRENGVEDRKLRAAVVIFAVQRQGDDCVHEMVRIGCATAAQEIWKSIRDLANVEIARHEAETAAPSVE